VVGVSAGSDGRDDAGLGEVLGVADREVDSAVAVMDQVSQVRTGALLRPDAPSDRRVCGVRATPWTARRRRSWMTA
jgi:hypothetical protein